MRAHKFQPILQVSSQIAAILLQFSECLLRLSVVMGTGRCGTLSIQNCPHVWEQRVLHFICNHRDSSFGRIRRATGKWRLKKIGMRSLQL